MAPSDGDALRNGLNAFYAGTRVDIFSWGVASIFADLLLLLLYSCLPRVRRTPGWLILYSTCCELYVTAGFVALSLIGNEDDPSPRILIDGLPAVDIEQQLCHEYGPLLLSILGFDMAANSWKLCMYVDLIVVYHNPFRPHTARPLYFLAVVAISAAWMVAISSSDVMCSSDDDGRVNVLTLTWGLVYAPFLLFVLLGGSLYVAVKALLSRDKSSNRISFLARQRVMQHCLVYLLMYGILLGMLAGGYAGYQLLATSPGPSRRVFAHCIAALTSGRPCFGFVGWALLNQLGAGDTWRASSLTAGGGPGSMGGTPSSLQQPLLDRASRSMMGGGRPSAGINSPQSSIDTAESGSWMEGAPAAEAAIAGDAAWGDGVHEAGFKEELRYELVSDVAIAISELAEREAREQHEDAPSTPLPSIDATTAQLISSEGSEPRLATLESTASGSDLSSSDLSSMATLHADLMSPGGFPPSPARWSTPQAASGGGGGGAAVAATSQRPTHVQHYAVAHFRAIRQTFGISAASFAAAFKRALPESDDSQRRLRESVSEGATGSFFYWVKHPDGSDTGYIVKQITAAEKNTLMAILPAYKAHVQARGGASLLQYLSCHSMNLRWQWSGKVYFVVMRNFFPIRPQLSFDLKGATANRRALKTWELHQTNTVAGLYSTLRDWEWMDIGMNTDLEDRDRAKVWSMICADCEFLQRQNLLDYSLLIGIYRPPATLIPQQKQALLQSLAAQCRGTAAVSRDRQKVFFFGVIDVLEKYTIRWRVQRVVLRLLYGLAWRWTSSDGISAMPPPLYADRFRTFMAHEVLHMEEEQAAVVLDEQWRAGRWLIDLCNLGRWLFGLPPQTRGARRGGKARWQRLWERRRRGLVKQRIVSEHEDQGARIKELEELVSILEYELACARGVHPNAIQLPGHSTSEVKSGSHSVDHAVLT